ncbi:hypothetical protein Tco_0053040 [Tanacetum coccineum]
MKKLNFRLLLERGRKGKGGPGPTELKLLTYPVENPINHQSKELKSTLDPPTLKEFRYFDSLELKILFVDWTILGVDTPPEDLNVKFLRSLPSEWDTHVVKRTAAVNNDDKNLAFLTTSSPSIYAFLSTQPQGSQLVHEDLEQLHDDDLEEIDLKWNMALLSMRERKFYQRTGRKIIIDGSKLTGYDKSKVECSSSKAVKIEDASEKAMCAIDGAGFDWSDMAEDEIQANMALMAFTDSEKQYDDLLVKLDDTGFKAATYKRGLSILKAQVVKYKESEVLFSEEIALLKRSVGHKEYLMGLLKTELEKVKEEKEGFEFKIDNVEKSSKRLR